MWRHIKIVAYTSKKSNDQNRCNFSYFDKISLFIDQKSKFLESVQNICKNDFMFISNWKKIISSIC
jgi:hypothetical protein